MFDKSDFDFDKLNFKSEKSKAKMIKVILEYVNTPTESVASITKKYGMCPKHFAQRLDLLEIPRNPMELCSKTYKHELKNINYFEHINSSDKAYWLGFLTADGSVIRRDKENPKGTTSLRLRLGEKDYDHLEKFKNIFTNEDIIYEEPINNGNLFSREDRKLFGVTIARAKIVDDLIKLNVVPNKSYKNLGMPNISNEFIYDFLRGLLDGDGFISLGKTNQEVGFIGTSNIIKDISEYINKDLGLHTTPTNITSSDIPRRIRIFGFDKCLKILDKIYKNSTEDTRLDRKYQVYIEMKSISQSKNV